MAALFPQARVTALDIKEPAESGEAPAEQRPADYSFVQGDILQGLPFADAAFDFTNQRLLFFAIPSDRWQFVVGDLARVTRPGGWEEVVEGHYGYEPMGPAAQLIADAMLPAMLQRGIDPRNSANLAQFLQASRQLHTPTPGAPLHRRRRPSCADRQNRSVTPSRSAPHISASGVAPRISVYDKGRRNMHVLGHRRMLHKAVVIWPPSETLI